MNGTRSRLAARVVLVVLILTPAACSRQGHGAPTGGSDSSPSRVKLQRLVDITPVQQRSIVYHAETVGVLEAEGQTDIAAGVSGLVDEVLFREGDFVTPGTVLVKIDQPRYEADAEAARANVERAQAGLDLARDVADRTDRLGRSTAEEERVKARAAVRTGDAELRTARAMLIRAEHNLNRSRVRAPYAGRINKRLVTKGSYLEEKTVIGTMADLSKIRLVGYVPETAAPRVRQMIYEQEQRVAAAKVTLPLGGLGPQIPWAGLAGMHLVQRGFAPSGFDPEFTLLALPGQTFYGRIFYMSTVAAPDTHMFEAKAEVLGWEAEVTAALERASRLPAPGSGQAQKPVRLLDLDLRPGLTARIRFPMRSNQDAMVIPEEAGKWEAVRPSEHGFIAFVPVPDRDDRGRIIKDRDGRPQWVAQRRTLELGYRAPGWVEVRAGLSPGEWVVRRGADTLEEGTPLQIPEEQLRQMMNDER